MCSSPNIPAPPPPPQAAKMPDSMGARRKARNPMLTTGTLLTGPGGAPASTSNTGGSTLLGG